MIESQRVQHSRVQIMNADGIDFALNPMSSVAP